jgi:hypothetical protein
MSVLKRVLKSLICESLCGGSTASGEIENHVHGNPLIEYLENNSNGRLIDRWNHYFDIYHRHFDHFRGQPLTMIEIGVFNGGSLPMWRDYFGPQATIVGVDINPECEQFAEPGIDIVIGDQADRAFLRSLSDRYPNFAILIDDGGHRMYQQITTFEELYPVSGQTGFICARTFTHLTCPYSAVGTDNRRPS